VKQSVVHIYLYGLIKREVQGGNLIHISKIHPIIKWVVRIPRKYQRDILSELVECGLLKKLDRDNYEIVTCRIKNPPIDSLGNPLW
jgi:hypothetical protein